MKYLKITKQFAAIGIAAMLFTACDKVETTPGLGKSGQTLVTLLEGGNPYNVIKDPVDFVPTPTTLTKGVIDIRREIPNSEELNKTITVTIKDDTAAVRAANASYVQFPTALYTLTLSPGITKTGGQGGVFTVVFQPGEFAKQIYINVPNATLLNPSSLYGLGFTITSADGGAKVANAKAVVVEVGAKNNWDGVYDITGTFSDINAAGAAFTGAYPLQYALVTTGANTCDVVDNKYQGYPAYIFTTPTGLSFYGSYGLCIGFNAATGAISDLHNYYGDKTKPATAGGSPSAGTGPPDYAASNTRRAVLDPSGVNAVQGNRDILIKHWMLQPSLQPSPFIRSFFNEKWAYAGPR
jgi:hypothetical protein